MIVLDSRVPIDLKNPYTKLTCTVLVRLPAKETSLVNVGQE